MGFEMKAGLIAGEGDDAQAAAKLAIARWTGELLQRHYPGHAWHVEVAMNARGGLIKIRINYLMPPNYWYNIKLSDAVSDPSGQLVKRGAGELLERYNIPRTGFMVDAWRTALNAMPIEAKLKGRGHLAPLKR